MEAANVNNTLYKAFKDVHPCWLFVLHACIKIVLLIPGVFFNSCLIYVTIRTKTLRGTANYLLALNSAIEIVHQLGHLPSIVTAFSGTNFITYPLAIRLTTPSVAALFAAGPSLFCTGIDRLLAVTFVKFYQQLKPGIYLSCLTLFCLGYSSFLIALVHKEIGQWEFLMVAGTIADLLQGNASSVYYQCSLVLNLATIGIYICVGILIHFRSEQNNVRIFRSLCAIITISVGGYLSMRIYTSFVLPNVGWSPVTAWNVRQFLTIWMNVSAGSNAPILYLTSYDYRKAFRKELKRTLAFLRKSPMNKGVGSTQVQVINGIEHRNSIMVRQSLSSMNVDRRWS